MKIKCSICGKIFGEKNPEQEGITDGFCSDICKKIQLEKMGMSWEEYIKAKNKKENL